MRRAAAVIVLFIAVAAAAVWVAVAQSPEDDQAQPVEQSEQSEQTDAVEDAQQQTAPQAEPTVEPQPEPQAGQEQSEPSAEAAAPLSEAADDSAAQAAPAESEESAPPAAVDEDDTAALPPAEPAADPAADPAAVIIRALDVERPRPALPPAERYRIVKGDTLSAIALRFGVALEALRVANGLERQRLLTVGQWLTIPADSLATRAEPAEAEQIAIETGPGLTSEGAFYGTIRDHERGTINSAAAILEAQAADTLLVAACIDEALRLYVHGIERPDGPVIVYWRIDAGPLQRDRWTTTANVTESPRATTLFNSLLQADSLWLRIAETEFHFPLQSLFETPVQANLIYCARR